MATSVVPTASWTSPNVFAGGTGRRTQTSCAAATRAITTPATWETSLRAIGGDPVQAGDLGPGERDRRRRPRRPHQ
jgi:hypothetical protein